MGQGNDVGILGVRYLHFHVFSRGIHGGADEYGRSLAQSKLSIRVTSLRELGPVTAHCYHDVHPHFVQWHDCDGGQHGLPTPQGRSHFPDPGDGLAGCYVRRDASVRMVETYSR